MVLTHKSKGMVNAFFMASMKVPLSESIIYNLTFVNFWYRKMILAHKFKEMVSE